MFFLNATEWRFEKSFCNSVAFALKKVFQYFDFFSKNFSKKSAKIFKKYFFIFQIFFFLKI